MTIHPTKKLGKQPAKIDSRTLPFARYRLARAALPSILSIDWTTAPAAPKSWPMLLNDQLGDCVVASALHKIQEWSALAGSPIQPTDQDALNIYELFGYKPGDPSTDNGIVMLDFLKYWRTTGLPVQGKTHNITAFVSVDWTNQPEVTDAIALLGAADIGVVLPITAQSQESVWSVPGSLSGDGAPGSWGGHCIPAMAATNGARYPNGTKVRSWGAQYAATWYFWQCYCDEMYAILAPEWIAANGLSPSDFDLAQLQADLAAL
jgi:hypothetical protein